MLQILASVALIISACAACVAAVGIWRGIRAMDNSNKSRARLIDQQHEAETQRHTETMRALEALIERTAP